VARAPALRRWDNRGLAAAAAQPAR
jgi:hypothetical protein